MKNYYRQFITLLQEKPGFALPGKEAAGRIVVEARGEAAKATVYIQDISPQNTYKLAFISRQGQASLGIVVGSIIVGERGRYEGRFEFDSRSIGGTGISCEEIEGAVVFVSGEMAQELIAPLSGFKSAPFSWRVNFNFADGKRVVNEPQGEAVRTAQTDVPIEEVPQPDAVPIPEMPEPEPVPEPEPEPAPEPEPEPEPIPEPAPVINTQAAPKPADDTGPGILFHKDALVDVFDERDGQKDPDINIKWAAITPQDMVSLGGKWAAAMNDPIVASSFKKYRHILLGQEKRKNQISYILGVPDIYRAGSTCSGEETEEHFCSFKLCRPGGPAEGAPGYWLKNL